MKSSERLFYSLEKRDEKRVSQREEKRLIKKLLNMAKGKK